MRQNIKKLSIVIPCYNEEGTIELILEDVDEVQLDKIKKEIIIIDDYSSDNTRKILKRLSKTRKDLKVIYQPKNQGKGAALKVGFTHSTGDLVVVQDADREYDPRDYKRMVDIFLEDRADIVFGSRFSSGAPRRVVYLMNTIANKLMTRLSAVLSGLYVTDIHTCYIMFDGDWIRTKAKHLRSKRFGFNPEIVAKIAREKEDLKICEVGISYYGRTKKEGKKIGYRDGISAIGQIIKYNILFR